MAYSDVERRHGALSRVRVVAGVDTDGTEAGKTGEMELGVRGRSHTTLHIGHSRSWAAWAAATATTAGAAELTSLFWADAVEKARAEGLGVGAFLRMYLTPQEHGLYGWDWSERPKMRGAAAVSVEQQKGEWIEDIRQLELWLRDNAGVHPMTTALGSDLLRKLALTHFSRDERAVRLLTPNHTIGGAAAERALRRANPLRAYMERGQASDDTITGVAAPMAAPEAEAAPGPPVVFVELQHVGGAKAECDDESQPPVDDRGGGVSGNSA